MSIIVSNYTQFNTVPTFFLVWLSFSAMYFIRCLASTAAARFGFPFALVQSKLLCDLLFRSNRATIPLGITAAFGSSKYDFSALKRAPLSLYPLLHSSPLFRTTSPRFAIIGCILCFILCLFRNDFLDLCSFFFRNSV